MNLYQEISAIKNQLELILQSSSINENLPDDEKELKHYLISSLFLVRLSRNMIIKNQCNNALGELNDHT